jgi:DNA-binding response OmpR family regulator
VDQLVLVVDDEPLVREVVARYLSLDGFAVHEAADGRAAADWLADHRPDIVVLDVMLPEVDGLALLKQIHAHSNIPVILLTARSDEVDRIVGLELGADDYIVKPFSPRELVARVRTVLRRSNQRATDATASVATAMVVAHGDISIDLHARDVLVGDRRVDLTAKEFDLLATLAGSPRRVFSRRQLLEMVWDSSPDYQDPATVTVHVGRLRQKIETDPDHPRRITTVRGVGYRFEP